MDENRPKCPACGRFVGDAWGDPTDAEYSPGFGDAAFHDTNGCSEYEADACGVATFCDESCADRFHQRR